MDDLLLEELEAAFAQEEQAAEPATAVAVREPPRSGKAQKAATAATSPLLALSEELLLRVLGKLSPDDLLALSQTSRFFHNCARDGLLWRKLYHARWPQGPQSEDAEHVQGSSWKNLYVERDQQAVLEAQRQAPSGAMLPIYLQMATARRSEPLSRADAEALFRAPPAASSTAQLSTKVDAFRRSRGLLDSGGHAVHRCRSGCSWSQLQENAWICEKSGFVHVCGADCTFRASDPSSDLQVCSISGRCFATMLTYKEEHAGEWERGQLRGDQEEEGWGAEEGISGRLGRAFYAGYEAEGPGEFFERFGVRF